MKNPLTDEALEELLTDYGKLPPAASFTYRPKAPLFTRRLAVLSVAALLGLLLLSLAAGAVAHFTKDGGTPTGGNDPFVTPVLSPSAPTSSLPTTTTFPNTPPVTTTTPVTPPPITAEPLGSLLPDWYKGDSIRLLNQLASEGISDLTPVKLTERYDDYSSYDVDMGDYSYSMVAGDIALLPGTGQGHTESYCSTSCLRNILTGEVICIGHEMYDLWESIGLQPPKEIGFVQCSPDAARILFFTNQGYYFYNRTAHTLTKVEFDMRQHNSHSVSPDCRFMVVGKARKGESIISDLWLINLDTMESKLALTQYDTVGMSTFTADGRYFYTSLLVDGVAENNEYAHWALYDTETGYSFRGEGQVLYLQDGFLVSRYPDGFHVYDCQSGETPDDLSALPRVIDGDYHNYHYNLTVFNPATGEIESLIPNIGAYALTADSRYLFYYEAHASGVVMMDLMSGESVTLPVSEAFLERSSPTLGQAIYSISISPDGSQIALNYRISTANIAQQTQNDIRNLQDMLAEQFLKAPNLPAFWKEFQSRRAPYDYLIRAVQYDIHEDYVNLQITYRNNGWDENKTSILYYVEDYRSDTFTLYFGSANPYSVGGLYARSGYETTHQTFRKKLSQGNYAASCVMLRTEGEERKVYLDFADCYTSDGKWSDDLLIIARSSYDLLKSAVVSSNLHRTPEELDRILQIVARYPLCKNEAIDPTNRRVADIYLYGQDGLELYCAQVFISAKGKYYLKNAPLTEPFACREITFAEYEFLMEVQGGFLYESGLYKDRQIASVLDSNILQAEYDFLVQGSFPIDEIEPMEITAAIVMIREGRSTEEIMEYLFTPEQRSYLALLSRHKASHVQYIYRMNTLVIRMELKDGSFSFTDPNPNQPIPSP